MITISSLTASAFRTGASFGYWPPSQHSWPKIVVTAELCLLRPWYPQDVHAKQLLLLRVFSIRRRSWMKNRQSLLVNWTRPRTLP
jgi:hypothetical protein